MKLVIRYGLILLSALLVFPSVVKVAHIFADHEHYSCDHYSDSHFHKEIPDCDIFTFQQSPTSSFSLGTYELVAPDAGEILPQNSYCFLNEHQELSFALRGPPSAV